MADSSEEISSYIEKFRLINEPKNHWKARKDFLMNNWNDYPEMQLVSLSMVWANMQFDGCRYAPDLMERVRDMARGISCTDADTDTETSGGSYTQHTGKPMSVNRPEEESVKYRVVNEPNAPKRPRLATVGELASTVAKDIHCWKDTSGNQIDINHRSFVMKLYPLVTPQPPNKFGKFCDLCRTLKSVCHDSASDTSQLRDVLWHHLSHLRLGLKFEVKCIDNTEKHNPKWKAFALIGDTLCATHVALSKKAAKEGAVNNLVNHIKNHRDIGLVHSSSREHVEVGSVQELVFMNEIAMDLSSSSQVQLEESSATKEQQKVYSAESILASQPREYASHSLNCKITAAPKIPNFFLVEFLKERAKYGYENPVSKLVNSASMCKVPLNFSMGKFVNHRGFDGQVCTVVLGGHNIATGLALGARDAKHLAAHHAIQALQMTNLTIRKSDKLERPKVTRDELTDGAGKAEVVPETNVGHKMLKMMGWKGEGVGLGKEEEGIAKPVEVKGTSSQLKEGLGFDLLSLQDPNTKKLDEHKVFQFLEEYAKSDREEELVFTSELSLDERKKLHNICCRLGLKSKSKGKGNTRYLTVGRKWDIGLLVKTVAEKGGNTGNYELVGPMFDTS